MHIELTPSFAILLVLSCAIALLVFGGCKR